MQIHIVKDNQYKEVANMIERAVRYSNFSKFYPKQSIEYVVQSLNEEGVRNRANYANFYVIEEN